MLPTKLVEYSRLGIPAAVTPTHANRYYFAEDQVAFVESENPEALAATILELSEDPARRLALATRAAEFFDQFHWDAHKQVYTDLVDRLCEGRTR